MLENKVVELMLEHSFLLDIGKAFEEVWIVQHLEVTGTRIDPNTSSGKVLVHSLVNATRQSRKERLVHQQSVYMLI
jgi:hypothetical protein